MRVSVGVEGSRVPIPAPASLDGLAPFVEALMDVRAGRGREYRRTVNPRDAGAVAVALAAPATGADRLLVSAARPFDGPSRHVARMRTAELVVDYLPGPPHPDSRFCYGGVFKASEDADELFASAEPPTHDDWIAKGLTGAARGVVQGSRQFVLKHLDEKFGFGGQTGGSGGNGLGQLAARLAGIVPVRVGASPSRGQGNVTRNPIREGDSDVRTNHDGTMRGRTTSGVRGGRPMIIGSPALRVHESTPYFVAAVRIPASDVDRIVTAAVDVVVDTGGTQDDSPVGLETPQILLWRAAVGDSVVNGDRMHLTAGQESDWWLYASHVPDAVVRFRISQDKIDAR
jgi:hypothetical protein